MIEDDTDREAFLDESEFGVVVAVTEPSGATRETRGILRNPTVEDVTGDTTIEGRSLELMLLESQASRLSASDDLVIGTSTYRMSGVPMSDGTGFAMIALAEVVV